MVLRVAKFCFGLQKMNNFCLFIELSLVTDDKTVKMIDVMFCNVKLFFLNTKLSFLGNSKSQEPLTKYVARRILILIDKRYIRLCHTEKK